MSASNFEPVKEMTELPRESFNSSINSDCPIAVINTMSQLMEFSIEISSRFPGKESRMD